ncbi:MAG: UDP-N-acetylmuramoyl-tripeptide--D-alanyl-D-alanine ligase [Candidatus Binataceae bacterium]|nr:UDP-N-acetylmuramoyl-tripeptide--D-alanyl-D-alanine ligase [Candidatus Binataceae bacterium]
MATPIPSNRCRLSAADIIRATGAQPAAAHELTVAGVSIDSRSIARGALFVALRGVRDGHEFLATAAARGAAAAIVERGRAHTGLPCYEVDDTLAALGALARFHLGRLRAHHALPTIAIGGAAGKTTTKELTAAIARALYGEILATPGNLNNLIGVPLTILTLTDAHRAAILECGTNQRGEIARLAAIVAPDAALVLNADVEHTEGLGSLEGVADEEAALFATARIAVVGVAETMLTARVPPGMRTVKFGAGADAEVRLASRLVVAPGRQRIAIALARGMTAAGVAPGLEMTLGLLGAASAMNTAAALAAVIAAHGRPLTRPELAAIARALAAVEPVAGRLATREVGDLIVIDDTYNANPRSVRVALEAARETADGLHARLVVALGDMLELGALAAEMHTAAIHDLLAARPDAAVVVGPELAAALAAHRAAAAAPAIAIETAIDSAAAAAIVRRFARPGDVILVKGSRGIAMERIIDGLAIP